MTTVQKWRWASVATVSGVVVFVLVTVTLHLLQSNYDPVYQLVSELALGRYGWAMALAFFGLSVSTFGLQAALRPFGAMLGLRLLLMAASLFFFSAGVFPLGATSQIHITSIAVAFVLVVLAMYLFPSTAGRAKAVGPKGFSWLLAVGVAGGVALGLSILPMGIGQRLATACLLVWLGVLGWRLGKSSWD